MKLASWKIFVYKDIEGLFTSRGCTKKTDLVALRLIYSATINGRLDFELINISKIILINFQPKKI